MTDKTADAEAPLTAAAALALLTDQQRTVAKRMGGHIWIICVAWGIAWLLGFLAIWTIDGTRPNFALPAGLAWTIFATLFGAALVVSAVLGIRSGRGIRSNSANAFTGTVYGVTWAIGMTAVGVWGAALLGNGMSQRVADLFFPSAYTLVVGLMYLSAAAIWRVVPMIVAGAWLVVLAAVSPFVGYPTNYLVFAIAGGVLFFALAIQLLVSGRSARGAAQRG